MMNSPLYERINEIYKLISESHKRHILQQDELSRLMLYSCLDTIEETEIVYCHRKFRPPSKPRL